MLNHRSNSTSLEKVLNRARNRLMEQKVQDILVILGFLLFFVTFGFLIGSYVVDDEWNDSKTKKTTVLASLFLFGVALLFLGLYIWWRIQSNRQAKVQQVNFVILVLKSEFFNFYLLFYWRTWPTTSPRNYLLHTMKLITRRKPLNLQLLIRLFVLRLKIQITKTKMWF